MNAYVFLFCFAAAYLLGGKRPLLRLSTRVLLIVLLGFGLWFLITPPEAPLHDTIGVATLLLNVVFVAFGVLDFVRYRREQPLL